MKTATSYRWKVRKSLVDYLRVEIKSRRQVFDCDGLEEFLTDLSRSGSWLSTEARAAICETDDAQWNRLLHDINHAQIFIAR